MPVTHKIFRMSQEHWKIEPGDVLMQKIKFCLRFPPNMIIINHFGTLVTILMFVYTFSLYVAIHFSDVCLYVQSVHAVLCSTRTAG